MKIKTLIFACLICFTALLTSCDNTMPQGGKHDDGDNGGDYTTPRSLSTVAIQASNVDNTIELYFREPIGIVNVNIGDTLGNQLIQQLVNTNDTALISFDIPKYDSDELLITITDTQQNIIYQKHYQLE